jgi:hypothetical protein
MLQYKNTPHVRKLCEQSLVPVYHVYTEISDNIFMSVYNTLYTGPFTIFV